MKFKYCVRFAFNQFRRKLGTSLLLSVLIMAASSLILIFYVLFMYLSNYYWALNDFKNHDIVISNHPSTSVTNKYDEPDALEGVEAESMKRIQIYKEADRAKGNVYIYVYDNIMIENMELRLSEGLQLYEADVKDGAYPVIIPENSEYNQLYDVGDVFYVYARVKEYIPIKYYVCGILEFPYYVYYSPGVYGGAETLLNSADSLDADFILSKNFIYNGGEYLSEVKSGSDFMGTFAKINFEKGTSEYNCAMAELLTTFKGYTIQNILDSSLERYFEASSDGFIAFLLVLFLTVVGIAGINMFMEESLKPEYALYFMGGATWTECVIIEAVRSVILVIVPSVIGCFSGYFIMVTSDKVKYFADIKMVGFVTSCVFVIYLITSLYFILKLKNTKPIDNIRLMVKE